MNRYTIKFLTTFFALLFSVSAERIDGFIEQEGNTVWSADTVVIRSNLTVGEHDTLTIVEGTVILTCTVVDSSNKSLTINGFLMVNGTDAHRVVFDCSPDSTLGISIALTGSSSAYLDYTVIQQQRFCDHAYSVFEMNDSASIHMENCECNVNQSVFTVSGNNTLFITSSSFIGNKSNNGTFRFEGISKNAVAVIESCRFLFNSNFNSGGVFAGERSCNLVVNKCEFANNSTVGAGGVFSLEATNSSIEITDCRFFDNKANMAGGVLYTNATRQRIKIQNSIFVRDSALRGSELGSAGALAINSSRGNVFIENSRFEKNIAGNGSCCASIKADSVVILQTVVYDNTTIVESSIPEATTLFISAWEMLRIANSTFAFNHSKMGPGLFLSGIESDNSMVVNSIFAGNVGSGQIWLRETDNTVFCNCYIRDEGNQSIVFQSSVENAANWVNIIESGELFIDMENGDLSLNRNSPCVNSGIADIDGIVLPEYDITGSVPRLIGNRIDIGAYEYPEVIGAKHLRPHPSGSAVKSTPPATMILCTLDGRLVYHDKVPIANSTDILKGILSKRSAGKYLVKTVSADGTAIVKPVINNQLFQQK